MIPDYYEIRARLAAAIAVLLPVAPPAYALGLMDTDCSGKTVTGILTLVALFLFSFCVRQLGKRIEAQLWSSWGGPPSTLLIMPTNPTLSEEMKQRIYKCVLDDTGIDIYPPTEMGTDWETRAWEAFGIVRKIIRKEDPKGVWFPHLAYYGLFRNLLGSCPLMHGIALFSTGWSFGMYLESPTRSIALTSCVLSGIIFIALPWFLSRRVLPEVTKEMAFRYAEQSWLSYIAISAKNERENTE